MADFKSAIAVVLCLVIGALIPPAEGFSTATYLGNGELGAITRNSPTTEPVGVLMVTDYTITAGTTVTTPTAGRLAIIATGTITIAGTIDGQGRGANGGAAGAAGLDGMGLPGAGSTSSTGATGAAGGAGGDESAASPLLFVFGGNSNGQRGYQGAGGGGGGQGTGGVNARGGAGGGGGNCAPGGSGGNAGTTPVTSGTPGAGGTGGAGVLLVARRIVLESTAVIDLDGNNGADATGTVPNSSSGGGAGAGGMLVMQARSIEKAAGYTITATGGTGGAGGGSGGAGAAGGAGGAIGCNAGSVGSSPTTGGAGGGGGGGGMVIEKLDASSAWTGAWNSATQYSYGDLALYNGLTYTALTSHANQQPDTNADDWTLMGNSGFTSLIVNVAESPGANCADGGRKISSGLDNGDGGGTERDGTLQSGEIDTIAYVCNGATGADGADGDTGPFWDQWQGTWDDDVTYVKLDAVHYAGSAWICNVATCDGTPAPGSSEWDFIANADGNIVISTAGNYQDLGLDGFLFALLWLGLMMLFAYRMSRAGPRYGLAFFFSLVGFLTLLAGASTEWQLGCLAGVAVGIFWVALRNKFGTEKVAATKTT